MNRTGFVYFTDPVSGRYGTTTQAATLRFLVVGARLVPLFDATVRGEPAFFSKLFRSASMMSTT